MNQNILQALTDLYNSTNGANWINKDNWLSTKPFGQWYGVTTDLQGNVTEINLQNNGLSGTIPSTIGYLGLYLKVLNLSFNSINGGIDNCGGLYYLEFLLLNNNKLTGVISNNITGLESLLYGDISGNSLDFSGSSLFVKNFLLEKNVNLLAPAGGSPQRSVFTWSLASNNTGAVTVPFNTPGISLGTSFGTMNNGVFTASRAVICQINITINCNNYPDGWGSINANWSGPRYHQYDGGITKFSVTQIVSLNSGDTYQWRPNNNILVYGGTIDTSGIEFIALN